MAYVLTEKSTIQCSHPTPGNVKATGAAKLTVGGSAVLLIDDFPSASIDCKMPDDQSKGIQHCSKVLAATTGKSTKLTVGGKAVALDTLKGTTDGLPAVITYSAGGAGQTKLKAV